MKTLKLAVCEKPEIPGVTQALIPNWKCDVKRECQLALSIYLDHTFYDTVELYVNFTNREIIKMVSEFCKARNKTLILKYKGGDRNWHLDTR